MNLKSKIALVTGASRGIGQAISISLAQQGCTVIINYKSDTDSAQKVMDMCNKHSQDNIMIKADVSYESEVKSMVDQIKNKYGHLDILINNAGIFDPNDSPSNIEAFDHIYKTNFLSSVLVTKYTLNIMKTGKIINISSIHGRLGYGRPSAIAYSAFKAAMENYTKNLAKDLAPNILVNAIAPGRVVTPMWGNPNQKQQIELGQAHATKKMILPEEIADGVLFILKNNSVCGEVLTIDGGYSLITLD